MEQVPDPLHLVRAAEPAQTPRSRGAEETPMTSKTTDSKPPAPRQSRPPARRVYAKSNFLSVSPQPPRPLRWEPRGPAEPPAGPSGPREINFPISLSVIDVQWLPSGTIRCRRVKCYQRRRLYSP